MADNKAAGAPALDTNIESGGFDEKRAAAEAEPAPAAPVAKKAAADDDDEDEDIDALIEDLESEDGHQALEEDEETPAGGRTVPEDMLQTDSRVGLTESEVLARRKKYGLNQMKEEKENHFLKFLSFFVGPIQFVMEVSLNPSDPLFIPRPSPGPRPQATLRAPPLPLTTCCLLLGLFIPNKQHHVPIGSIVSHRSFLPPPVYENRGGVNSARVFFFWRHDDEYPQELFRRVGLDWLPLWILLGSSVDASLESWVDAVSRVSMHRRLRTIDPLFFISKHFCGLLFGRSELFANIWLHP